MKIGIVGAKLSGKSTLFEAVTGIAADPSKYHGSTPQPGIVKVPDSRLDFLFENYLPEKKVNAVIELLDFPGIELGSRTGTAKSLLAEIRNASDALVLVLKAFDKNDFAKEYENLLAEFLFADLEIIEKRKQKLQASLIKPTKTHKEAKAQSTLHLKSKLDKEGIFKFLGIL